MFDIDVVYWEALVAYEGTFLPYIFNAGNCQHLLLIFLPFLEKIFNPLVYFHAYLLYNDKFKPKIIGVLSLLLQLFLLLSLDFFFSAIVFLFIGLFGSLLVKKKGWISPLKSPLHTKFSFLCKISYFILLFLSCGLL